MKFNLRTDTSQRPWQRGLSLSSKVWSRTAGAIPIAHGAKRLQVTTAMPAHIFKFAPDGERDRCSAPFLDAGRLWAWLSISAGNLYAADGDAQTIYKFAPDGTRTVFVGPSAFGDGESPVDLTFDSAAICSFPPKRLPIREADSIVDFSPNRREEHLRYRPNHTRGAWRLTARANLFVAESKRRSRTATFSSSPPGGGAPTVFASGIGRPEFLTFGPPR